MPLLRLSIKKWIRSWFARPCPSVSRSGRVRPRLEALEDRLAPAVVSDSGTLSLTIQLALGENLAVVSSGTSYTFTSNLNLIAADVTDPVAQGTNLIGLG